MITVCIPTLNRYDLLENCVDSLIAGSLKPYRIDIIDNGGELNIDYYHDKYGETEDGRVYVAVSKMHRNMGVSKSWNIFIESTEHPFIICNDDLVFGKNDIQNFYNAYIKGGYVLYGSKSTASGANLFSCFMPTKELIQKVGLFDENIYPAYFEDNDYAYRMKLRELENKILLVNTELEHFGSATIKAYAPSSYQKHHWEFRRNRKYYIDKWGGLPGEESFTVPFNGVKGRDLNAV